MTFASSSPAQWVGAIATSSAVLIALFKEEFLKRWRRPKLIARIQSKPPDCLLSAGFQKDGQGNIIWTGDAYWIRLWIENRGRSRAEQVQVFIAELYKRDTSKNFVPLSDFAPMNLRWANARDWRNPEIFAPGISHQMGKHCDLCDIVDPSKPRPGGVMKGYEGQSIANLQLEVFPTNERHRLTPGEYCLRLMVAGANADPVESYVELTIRGTWSSDMEVMFRDCVGVAVTPAAPAGLLRTGTASK